MSVVVLLETMSKEPSQLRRLMFIRVRAPEAPAHVTSITHLLMHVEYIDPDFLARVHASCVLCIRTEYMLCRKLPHILIVRIIGRYV